MQSCVVVKKYDKLYINDPDMKLAAEQLKKLLWCIVKTTGQMEEKTGGGCGCN
jgi:hypothetical protein